PLRQSPISSPLVARPPTPPLFPYTTLFRSDRAHLGQLRRHAGIVGYGGVDVEVDEQGVRHTAAPILALISSGIWEISSATVIPADRKSTRLNSSHLVISYAVFCLKKKI